MKTEVLRRIPEAESFLRHCERLTFKQRQTIFKQGEGSDSLYLVLEGSVSVIIDDDQDSDQEMVVSYLNPGDFFGEMGLFGEEVRSANLVARVPSEVARISYERFHQVRGNYADLMFELATQIGNRLRTTTRKLTDLAFVDVAGRIAQTLNDLTMEPDAMTHPDGMQIRITRQELGKIVGCSREMAGRVLKALKQDGLIEVSGKTIVVLREPKTAALDDEGQIVQEY